MQSSDDPVIERALARYFADWPDAPEPGFYRSRTLEIAGVTYVALANVHGPLAMYRVAGEDLEDVDPEHFVCEGPIYDALVREGIRDPIEST